MSASTPGWLLEVQKPLLLEIPATVTGASQAQIVQLLRHALDDFQVDVEKVAVDYPPSS
jgi:hypothetical protein